MATGLIFLKREVVLWRFLLFIDNKRDLEWLGQIYTLNLHMSEASLWSFSHQSYGLHKEAVSQFCSEFPLKYNNYFNGIICDLISCRESYWLLQVIWADAKHRNLH